MFRKFALALVAVTVAVSAQLLATPAGADTTDSGAHEAETIRCVTAAEFRQSSKAMTKARVHGTFGTSGSFGDGGAGGYSRIYSKCAPNADCDVLVEYNVGPRGVHRVVNRAWNGVC